MALLAGSHHLDTGSGRVLLTTLRDGLAAQAGHDLVLEAARWSAELVVGDDLEPMSLEVRIDMDSLAVREGTGGLKPLTDRDRREIAVTARKVLGAQRHPQATFSATTFEAAQGGGGVISGTLTLAGRSRPLRLSVSQPGPGDYRATATIVQSDFGIKPYSGFLGALKVRDGVGLQVEVSLPESGAAGSGEAASGEAGSGEAGSGEAGSPP